LDLAWSKFYPSIKKNPAELASPGFRKSTDLASFFISFDPFSEKTSGSVGFRLLWAVGFNCHITLHHIHRGVETSKRSPIYLSQLLLKMIFL
jgi:hypothetical protein